MWSVSSHNPLICFLLHVWLICLRQGWRGVLNGSENQCNDLWVTMPHQCAAIVGRLLLWTQINYLICEQMRTNKRFGSIQNQIRSEWKEPLNWCLYILITSLFTWFLTHLTLRQCLHPPNTSSDSPLQVTNMYFCSIVWLFYFYFFTFITFLCPRPFELMFWPIAGSHLWFWQWRENTSKFCLCDSIQYYNPQNSDHGANKKYLPTKAL